jgi:hypothetical protein
MKIVFAALAGVCCAQASDVSAAAGIPIVPAVNQEVRTMKVRLTIDGKAIDATLLDNATARDFLLLLPLTLTLEDYASTEKISYLPRKLSTADAPAGVDPGVGDIAYYAPWGNVAIFYKDAPYAKGLIRLGRIDSGVESLSVRGALKATIISETTARQ